MKHYYADKSTVPWEYDYFIRFPDHNPDTDPCLGLYQRHHGKFNLLVISEDIVSIPSTQLHPLQKRYHMESGYDEDFVICPTLQSILSGNVPLPFRVNHSEFKFTHRLVWIPHEHDYPHSHYMLEGVREIESDTEVTFNYKFGSVTYKL